MTGHLITTAAVPAQCPRCHADVITGHAEGVPAVCDPTHYDPRGESIARLLGRATYDLTTAANRTELVYRDQFRLGIHNWPVLVQHKCSADRQLSHIADPAEQWREKKKPKQRPPNTAPQLPFEPANDLPPF